MRWNVRRDCGVESKPRPSGGILSAWTSRPGVSWMVTVVTQSGKYGSGGGQHVISVYPRVPPTQRERLRV